MSIRNILLVSSGLFLTTMAQDASTTNPLNAFISIAQSLATQFETSTTSPTSTTLSTTTSSLPSTAALATPISSTSASNLVQSTASTTPTATAAAAAQDTGLSSGARTAIIVVCAVVGALLLALIALGCFCCLRRRRKRERTANSKAEQEIGSPLKDNDWSHGNDSHHGYIGVPAAAASQPEMSHRYPEEKTPRHSISQVEDPEPPNLAEHPAFSRDADPYTAAGVGAAGIAAEERRRSRSRSLGERRYSGQMPKRKPVGTPPSTPSRHRAPSLPSCGHTGAAAGTGAAMVGAAAAAGAASQRPESTSYQPSGSATSSGDYFDSTRRSNRGSQPEPTIASPLSSHPSNPLLVSDARDHRRSLPSQRDLNDPAYDSPTDSTSRAKRPQTPLGFDFGLASAADAREHHHATEQEPLVSDYESQPVTAPISKYNSNPRLSSGGYGISNPTAAQRRSLEGRSLHYLDHDATAAAHPSDYHYYSSSSSSPPAPLADAAPEIPTRSPRRQSRSSFDYDPEVLAVPPRSPKRASYPYDTAARSRESLGTHPSSQTQPPRDMFRDSGDYAYPSPYSAHEASPRHSPLVGPAPGHRNRGSMGSVPGHPVYGVGNSGAASSVESWASARATPGYYQTPVPTPWEDNAIRRNSSSGNLKRPVNLHDDRVDPAASERPSPGHERSLAWNAGNVHDGRGAATTTTTTTSSSAEQHHWGSPAGASQSEYEGAGGGFDATWGAGNVEEPVFERYGAPPSSRRRRSGSSGFDPRYGRWTDSTYDELYSHGGGVGEAL